MIKDSFINGYRIDLVKKNEKEIRRISFILNINLLFMVESFKTDSITLIIDIDTQVSFFDEEIFI